MIRGARGADTTPRSSDDRQARFSRFVTSTKYLAGQTVQPFESLAHCGDSGGQIDPWGWTQSQRLTPGPAHSPRARTYSIKIRMHLDPTRGRRHHGQPATRFVRRLRFPGGQLHRHQPPGRRSARLFYFQRCFLRCRFSAPKLNRHLMFETAVLREESLFHSFTPSVCRSGGVGVIFLCV